MQEKQFLVTELPLGTWVVDFEERLAELAKEGYVDSFENRSGINLIHVIVHLKEAEPSIETLVKRLGLKSHLKTGQFFPHQPLHADPLTVG